VMALMDDAIPWIEEQSGIDVTPCHDADGTWNPSPACRNFSMAPHSPGRTWTSGCAEPALSPALASCGPGYVPDDGGVAEDASAPDAHAPPLHPDASPPSTGEDPFRPRVHSQACALGGPGGAAWPWLLALAALLRRRKR